MGILVNVISGSWKILLDSSVYVLFGLLVAGLLRVFINPASIAKHLGKNSVSSVFKAALFGIPIPLCSCGVLPAAASLKKQGASNGATTAFLISTPESGVDSIAITYALLDPVMTIARPISGMITASAAGISENLFKRKKKSVNTTPDLSCPLDNCCDGIDCPPEVHRNHHKFSEKTVAGMKYAFKVLWGDLASWFYVGILLSGLIGTLIPDDILTRYLGGGLSSMLLMLMVGIPIYICATASTPIAAALILKGVSPGAALVFLLAGPATNITSLTVLLKVIGKRATTIYLGCIGIFSVLCGLALDWIYSSFGFSAKAMVGQASEAIPFWLKLAGTLFLVSLSAKPVYGALKRNFYKKKQEPCKCKSDSCCS